MKRIINTKRTTNGRPYRKDLSVTFGATSPARRGFGRAMLAPTGTTHREGKADNRRGFTIVELVVAMVIIVLVSGAGISLVMTQTKVDSQAIQTVEATNICENAIECFRYAVNASGDDEVKIKTEFYEAFKLTGALDTKKYPQKDADEKVIIYSDYEINTSGATINIAIVGNTDENGIITHTIKIYAVDSFGVVIFDDSYTK